MPPWEVMTSTELDGVDETVIGVTKALVETEVTETPDSVTVGWLQVGGAT
jgi:hypothetical protein